MQSQQFLLLSWRRKWNWALKLCSILFRLNSSVFLTLEGNLTLSNYWRKWDFAALFLSQPLLILVGESCRKNKHGPPWEKRGLGNFLHAKWNVAKFQSVGRLVDLMEAWIWKQDVGWEGEETNKEFSNSPQTIQTFRIYGHKTWLQTMWMFLHISSELYNLNEFYCKIEFLVLAVCFVLSTLWTVSFFYLTAFALTFRLQWLLNKQTNKLQIYSLFTIYLLVLKKKLDQASRNISSVHNIFGDTFLSGRTCLCFVVRDISALWIQCFLQYVGSKFWPSRTKINQHNCDKNVGNFVKTRGWGFFI